MVSANIFFLPLKVYAILVYHHSFWKQHHKYDDEVFYLITVFGKIISLTHQTNRWSNWYQLTLYYIFLPLKVLCYSCLPSFFFKKTSTKVWRWKCFCRKRSSYFQNSHFLRIKPNFYLIASSIFTKFCFS